MLFINEKIEFIPSTGVPLNENYIFAVKPNIQGKLLRIETEISKIPFSNTLPNKIFNVNVKCPMGSIKHV